MPSSTNHETAVNITFGIAAVLFSLLTLWQAHRFWGLFRRHGHHAPRSNDDAGLGAADVELAPVSTRASTAVDEIGSAVPHPSGEAGGSPPPPPGGRE